MEYKLINDEGEFDLQYKFTRLRYWGSNVVLIDDKGEEYTVPESYYLIEENNEIPVQDGRFDKIYPANKREEVVTSNIPLGDYKAVRFQVGVEPKYNDNLALRSGELNALNGMAKDSWMWFTSYIFTSLSGEITWVKEVGSYYMGILPEFNKRFAGLRYQHKLLQTHLGSRSERTHLTNDETYQSIEASRLRTATNYFAHSMWAGVGVKAPTGQYDQGERSSASQDSPNTFQLGTASTDFMINVAYDARLMDAGVNINMNYKINTENRYDYRCGNKLTGNVLAYYKFFIDNKFPIAPNIGIMYEKQQKDEIYGLYNVAQSGGFVTTGILGAEFNIGKRSFGANYQSPFSQNLADGRVLAGDRVMTHISFGF